MLVRGVQGVYVSSTYIAWRSQVCRAPGESTFPKLRYEHIGGEPRPSAIAVGERMDEHETMMKSHGQFIGRVGLVLDPITGIVQDLSELGLNPIAFDADVAFGLPVDARPRPNVIEHAPMKSA